jgi:hypothetical protein
MSDATNKAAGTAPTGAANSLAFKVMVFNVLLTITLTFVSQWFLKQVPESISKKQRMEWGLKACELADELYHCASVAKDQKVAGLSEKHWALYHGRSVINENPPGTYQIKSIPTLGESVMVKLTAHLSLAGLKVSHKRAENLRHDMLSKEKNQSNVDNWIVRAHQLHQDVLDEFTGKQPKDWSAPAGARQGDPPKP